MIDREKGMNQLLICVSVLDTTDQFSTIKYQHFLTASFTGKARRNGRDDVCVCVSAHLESICDIISENSRRPKCRGEHASIRKTSLIDSIVDIPLCTQSVLLSLSFMT